MIVSHMSLGDSTTINKKECVNETLDDEDEGIELEEVIEWEVCWIIWSSEEVYIILGPKSFRKILLQNKMCAYILYYYTSPAVTLSKTKQRCRRVFCE